MSNFLLKKFFSPWKNSEIQIQYTEYFFSRFYWQQHSHEQHNHTTAHLFLDVCSFRFSGQEKSLPQSHLNRWLKWSRIIWRFKLAGFEHVTAQCGHCTRWRDGQLDSGRLSLLRRFRGRSTSDRVVRSLLCRFGGSGLLCVFSCLTSNHHFVVTKVHVEHANCLGIAWSARWSLKALLVNKTLPHCLHLQILWCE